MTGREQKQKIQAGEAAFSAASPAKKGREGLSRGVLKVMALFSGLQCFNILCSIVKMKLVALWLHSAGVGLFGIFNTTVDTLATVTDMGLRQSAVRDVAANHPANQSGGSHLQKVVGVVRRWTRFSGLLGAVVMSGISFPLSLWFFGDTSHWWMFLILSVAMLCNALVGGEQAILQGTRNLKALARSSLVASVAGLAVSVPMFRWMGDVSVPLSIIAYGVAGTGAMSYFRFKSPKPEKITPRETWTMGKGFVSMGVYMALGAFATNIGQLFFLAWLGRNSSLGEVGLYQSGTTIIVRYVGLIFTAVAMEFYPRLAAYGYSRMRTSVFVRHEMTLLTLVLVPVVLVFLLLRQWVVVILYSEAFLEIIPFISFGVLSCLFRASSWCMAFVTVSRGDGRIYILTEVVDSVIGVTLAMAGWTLAGFVGLGIAFIAWYFCYTVISGIIYRFRFHFRLPWRQLGLNIGCFLLCLAALLSVDNMPAAFNVTLLPVVAALFVYAVVRYWKRS